MVRLFLLALVLSLLVLEWFMEMDTEATKIYNFYCSHVLVPLLLVIVIQLICNIYSIIAWTRTSLSNPLGHLPPLKSLLKLKRPPGSSKQSYSIPPYISLFIEAQRVSYGTVDV